MKGAQARGLPVLLVPMKAPGNFGPEFAADFDAIYPDLAAEYGATLAPDFFAPLRAINPDPAALAGFMQADGIHPAANGVAEIVKGLGPLVKDLAALAAAP
jgi:acyl-CoA thioesterase-1